jgi:hypothetical protein
VHPVNALGQRAQIEYQFSLGRGQIERSSFSVSLFFNFRFSDENLARNTMRPVTRRGQQKSQAIAECRERFPQEGIRPSAFTPASRFLRQIRIRDE